ncbi:hypothetical protein C8R44DRAFT_796850 [Mycena epipterygia]|nr:hypothetical protein C8R44DRAFT_796850 [Mycena epipterygia]
MRQVAESETYFLRDLAGGLIQLALYLSAVGDDDGTSAATAECEEIQKKIELLPPQSDFLFEEIVQEPEEETCEPEEILEDTVFLALAESAIVTSSSLAEAVVSEATVHISQDIQSEAAQSGISFCTADSDSLTDSEVATQVPVSVPFPVTCPSREGTTEQANSRKRYLANLLVTPLRLEVKINPWCILLGILFALVWSRK